MGRTAHTTCDWPDDGGCDRSPSTGHPLFRTNPKGELGVFMCADHAERERAIQQTGT